jgi:trans-aconitate 2-methyltransferase
MSQWNPELYLRYEKERTQPSRDLVARIPIDAPEAIIDLGCGPGNSTAILRKRWPGAAITGLDSSPAMLEAASKSDPGTHWIQANIAEWQEEDRFDLVFANASLQWVAGHRELCRRLLCSVRSGGFLAFQMPALYDQPASIGILEVAKSDRWRPFELATRSKLTVELPACYYEYLAPFSSDLVLWETVYIHVLNDHKAIVEWYRSTQLRFYLDALPDGATKEAFEEDVVNVYRERFPTQRDGKVLFPFRRLFVIARK